MATNGIASPDVAALLRDLRALAADAGGPVDAGRVETGAGATQSFSDLLARAVDTVNEMQGDASSLATAFERGEPDVSLAQVMVASQKAGVAFEALTEVRNRLVRAYQDVMNMPV